MRKKINNTGILRINKSCAYFPCHKPLEDCAFCYCPFYPCGNQARGDFILTKYKLKIWSCKECSWIHKKSVVDNLFAGLKKGFALKAQSSKLNLEKTGIIILGHGSKLKEANNTLRDVTKQIKRQGPDLIEPAYLQLHKPALHASVKKIIKKGCRKVIIVPFFLFMGNHVKRDIPREIKNEERAYPGVEFVYAKNIGGDPRIGEIVIDCIKGAL